jgi:ABC-2 type transport system ATP-binding protein
MPRRPAITTSGLSKSYGRQPALVDVDLSVDAGEIFGYLGPNGAGKSTTLRILMGMLRPTSGSATVLGLDCWSSAPRVHRRVGYVPGELALYEKMTGFDHVSYFGQVGSRRGGFRAADIAERLDLDLGKSVRVMSRGNRQKLGLVLALMSSPELLILDEPTTGLDPIMQREFDTILREHTAAGGTVLLSSHLLSEVQQVADRIGVLREGRLIAVEKLHTLRQKSLHHLVVEFDRPVRADAFRDVDGVRNLVVDGATLRCDAPEQALDELVHRIAQFTVVDLECAEADLEETFMTYYGTESRDVS